VSVPVVLDEVEVLADDDSDEADVDEPAEVVAVDVSVEVEVLGSADEVVV
jgi:hypothetical protein